jgi:hypothetical protein
VWSTSCPGRFTPEEGVLGIHLILRGGWVDLRAGLDVVGVIETFKIVIKESRKLLR